MSISLKQLFYAIACMAGLFVLLYFGRPVLVSLSIALLFSFILYPVTTKLEAWYFGRISAAMISLVLTVGLIAGILYLFSTQIVNLMSDFTDFEKKLTTLSENIISYINNSISIIPHMDEGVIMDTSQKWVEESGGDIVSDTFNRTASIVSGVFIIIVYTFLLLIYRSGLKQVFVIASNSKHKEKVSEMINRMQKVGQNYLLGMSIMIAILGTANSLVLLIFGIDHAFFFGFLAAVLSIIPYVGTTIGASIPTLYAFMTHESYWVPLGIAITFWFIQLIESNFLSPKIVGGNLNVNALAAILSLIVGGYLWGVAGMALFLPLTAIFRVFCNSFEELKPVSLLLGGELYGEKTGTDLKKMKEGLEKAIKKK